MYFYYILYNTFYISFKNNVFIFSTILIFNIKVGNFHEIFKVHCEIESAISHLSDEELDQIHTAGV